MFRSSASARWSLLTTAARPCLRSAPSKSPAAARFISTAPPAARSRSWKNRAVRLALAGGVIYYYNTSPIFANEPNASIASLDSALHHVEEPSAALTIDKIVEEKHQREAQEQAAARRAAAQARAKAEAEAQADSKSTTEQDAQSITKEAKTETDGPTDSDAQGTAAVFEAEQEEADQQGAFNPETGEINWDCPCLGGMAHGPCGEEFKAAFSCFVYSTEEPKGMECIEKFKGMQDCFRLHPDVYGAELADDEDDESAPSPEPVSEEKSVETSTEPSSTTSTPASSPDETTVPKEAFSAVDSPVPAPEPKPMQ